MYFLWIHWKLKLKKENYIPGIFNFEKQNIPLVFLSPYRNLISGIFFLLFFTTVNCCFFALEIRYNIYSYICTKQFWLKPSNTFETLY